MNLTIKRLCVKNKVEKQLQSSCELKKVSHKKPLSLKEKCGVTHLYETSFKNGNREFGVKVPFKCDITFFDPVERKQMNSGL